MNAIAAVFERARRDGRAALIPFLTAGFPRPGDLPDLVAAVVEAGADLVEIGLPFSDPLADGPVIQRSSQQALAQGMTVSRALDLAARARRRVEAPLVFMGYLNPLLAYGLQRFCADAVAAGVGGLIVPDLPVEEAGALRRAARSSGLAPTFLIAPTSPPERIRAADRASAVFSYCVALTGTTGAALGVDQDLRRYLRRVRRLARKPFVVGFGVSRPQQVRSLARLGDGVVVGSALIRCLEQGPPAAAAGRAAALVRRLRRGARR
jgi:tryptophan synthase alpha chain